MPKWKPNRRPDTFPAAYSTGVLLALDRSSKRGFLPTNYSTEWEANQALKDFRYWRWAIRNHPSYHLHEVETTSRITARKLYHDRDGFWVIQIEVKPILGDLLQFALTRCE